MCELFSYICVFQHPINTAELFDKYKIHFYPSKMDEKSGELFALKHINKILQTHGYTANDFNLPSLKCFNFSNNIDLEISELRLLNNNIEELVHTLTNAQTIIFNTIIDYIYCNDRLILNDGPEGCGKSYLLNTLITYFTINNINTVTVAWTGIAANSLHNGRTVHTTFKLPLNINNSTTCNIKPNCKDGNKMRNLKVIIWDEITMISKYAFEAVDRMFKDVCNKDIHFGGKVIIVSGDFRQTLPVENMEIEFK